MINLGIQTFWFLLPAAIANLSPVVFKWIPVFNYPIHEKLFGTHKTYRGFILGILMAILTVYIQKKLYPNSFSIINYSEINSIFLGFLFGFGSLLGDLIKSFFKRKIKISPGNSWIPFDQLDWIIGALLLVNFMFPVSWKLIISSIIIFGLLHPITNILGYTLKIKKNLL